MKKVTENLKKLESSFIGLLNNHSSKILGLATIFFVAFFIVSSRGASHATEEMILMENNSNLLIENHSLKFMIYKQGVYINEQKLIIDDLRDFKKAVLKNNWTQNENTKRKEYQVVGKK